MDVSQPDMADLTGQLDDIIRAADAIGSQATVGSSQATVAANSSQQADGGNSSVHAHESVTPIRNVRQRMA